MLDEIHARNIGLISDATVRPSAGLTVITGETGTGKTLMLGALRLIRGDNASKDVIGPHQDEGEVVARLLTDDVSELVIRRTVTRTRSRAYIDGSPIGAGELATRVAPIVTIVSQHDQHALTSSDKVRRVVDGMLTTDERRIRDTYSDAYSGLRSIEAEMDALGSDQRALERERDMLMFQIDEIEDAGFSTGDEEALRNDLDRLRNVEELSTEVMAAFTSLGDDGVGGNLGDALSAVERAARLDNDLKGVAEHLHRATSILDEAAGDLSRYAEDLESNPGVLSSAEARLSVLNGLKRKYGDSVSDIERFAKMAAKRVHEIEDLIASASDIESRHSEAVRVLADAALTLTAFRRTHAHTIAIKAIDHLKDLGFVDPVVKIDVSDKEPTSNGADHFQVVFASEASLTPGPVASVASGGELSRLVLAITLAAGMADADVVAFDEIDAGIGGSTALAMGEKLKRLSATRQVICVTHLPQVAAFGDTHYRVVRDGSVTSIDAVSGTDRVEEISRMLAGLASSDKGKEHAEELLEMADSIGQRS
ncbi:MAG: AAA family ATPase [Proteobacteria bacterium]|nr:AAA family ATPase [Pseudomonadota bacterium]